MSSTKITPGSVHRVVFVSTYDGPVVVEHVSPSALSDPASAARSCRDLSRKLGGLPVVQRCASGHAMLFGGDPHLRRFAADPIVDCLPVVELSTRPPALVAAA